MDVITSSHTNAWAAHCTNEKNNRNSDVELVKHSAWRSFIATSRYAVGGFLERSHRVRM